TSRSSQVAKYPQDYEIKDSGKREHSETGAVRDTEDGKGRYDLLPPEAVRRLAVHYQNGAKKYADRNWEKGQKFSRVVSSMLRHGFQYLNGKRDEDHLAAVAWNAFALMTFEERERVDLDDLAVAVSGVGRVNSTLWASHPGSMESSPSEQGFTPTCGT